MNCQYSHIIYRWVVCANIHHVDDCIHLSTFRFTTISNTVMCTLHNSLNSRKLSFIHTSTALLLSDNHILVMKKLHVRVAYILFYIKIA